jgi:hypothetical protein
MLIVSRRAAALVVLANLHPPQRALAAQGAAEMDLEFYVRGLLGVPPSPPAAPEAVPPPRLMDGTFVASALEATEEAIATALATSPGALREVAASRRRGLSLEYNRVLSSGAFGDGRGYDAAAGIATQSTASQFGFDLTLLTLFTQLADARLPRADAAQCSKRLGAQLLSSMQVQTPAAAPSIGELVVGMRELLGRLQAAGYVRSSVIDESDADEALWKQRSTLSATRLSVTLTDSASLRAALLLNGRDGASPEVSRRPLDPTQCHNPRPDSR